MGTGSLVQYEWRVVPDFPDYEVTSLGNIRKSKSKDSHAVNLTRNTETVQLTKDGKRYHRTLASVVRAAFPGVLYP
jgi:hypothetical protein